MQRLKETVLAVQGLIGRILDLRQHDIVSGRCFILVIIFDDKNFQCGYYDEICFTEYQKN